MSASAWSPDELLATVAAPTDWRKLRASTSRDEWAALREWVTRFKDRYVLDHRVVPPCWYLHGALVDVLSALRDHHEYAFGELQPATAASEWHRVFSELEQRLRDWASRTGCTRDQHRPDVTVDWPDDRSRWGEHLAEDEKRRLAAEQAQRFEDD